MPESFIAERKPRREYETLPEGQYQGAICEVQHMGLVTRTYPPDPPKTNAEIRIWWQLDKKDSNGNIFYVKERDMTLSLDPKSNLFAFIKKLFKKEPPATFDTQKLVGTQRLLTIEHNPGKGKYEGKVFANVAAMLSLPASTPKLELVPRPKRDEVKAEVAKTTNAITEANPITDEDIPF